MPDSYGCFFFWRWPQADGQMGRTEDQRRVGDDEAQQQQDRKVTRSP